jgi:septin 7
MIKYIDIFISVINSTADYFQMGSSRREAREAYFKSDSSSKYESTSLRDREKVDREKSDKERSYLTSSSSLQTQSSKATKEVEGYVGFANLPNQVYRKAVKKGFDFTLMVVGTYLIIANIR